METLMKRRSMIALAGYAAFNGMALQHADAVDRHWNIASGSWNLAADWSPNGVPGTPDNAYVDFFNGTPGLATVISNVGSPGFVQVNNGDTINVTSHGEMNVPGFISLGV